MKQNFAIRIEIGIVDAVTFRFDARSMAMNLMTLKFSDVVIDSKFALAETFRELSGTCELIPGGTGQKIYN